MTQFKYTKSAFLAVLCVAGLIGTAFAEGFNIPSGTLESALTIYSKQTGVELIVSGDAINGARTKGVKGEFSDEAALTRLLAGTGFIMQRHATGAVAIIRDERASEEPLGQMNIAAATAPTVPGASLETVTVTSSKIGGDVQNIPIAITAFSQEQLTATQTTGGPDLVKQVPNLTFTKTNFIGYSIQIRGIGTQAISVTTDPAVAVAFNDVPFIRNHFFEQEFYDVSQVEVLRGPQGTLYGRNATAGVVNLVSAKPTDQFEAMVSLEMGNYGERRPEGMINIPIVDDRLDIRIAGEWTKRQGYSFNTLTDQRIDGRDLWSGRVTVGWKPASGLNAYLVWEHFSEDDDRIRSSKQLCKTAPIPEEIDGIPVSVGIGTNLFNPSFHFTQGCLPASPYSPESFEAPNGAALGYYLGLSGFGLVDSTKNPYADVTQSTNLRVIDSTMDPRYQAKNDTIELNADYTINPALSIASQTAYSQDFLWATEDYNRFNSTPGIFLLQPATSGPRDSSVVDQNHVFCDPQLGCSDRLVAEDLSAEHAWQFNQEIRLTSSLNGSLNFSLGANYQHYETEENYYVFINSLSLLAAAAPFGGSPYMPPWNPGVSDNHECPQSKSGGFQYPDPTTGGNGSFCMYIDPNPISKLNNNGHNYFLSQNPYTLNSYAIFGETYYTLSDDVKLIGGLRWTEDRKHFVDIPSELIVSGFGYPSTGILNQQWDQFTGRFAVNWTPKLSFTDQTLVYASYARGYKAGGANPPGAILIAQFTDVAVTNPVHPLTFKPEFVNAFELGSKNTLLDGSLTLNGDVFYYDYKGYQISYIVDRTSVNLNFDATVKGSELEATWEPLPGLRFNFGGGWEDTALAKGSRAIDLIDRTASNPDWIVVRPFVTQASNCILPAYVAIRTVEGFGNTCGIAYVDHLDPGTGLPYVPNPTVWCTGYVDGDIQKGCQTVGPIDPSSAIALYGYTGFDPTSAPNNGEGFYKDLSGNKLPNAPPFTVSFGAQDSVPLSADWVGTLRGDFYWQDSFWGRVFNDNPNDRIHGYTNLNLAVILTSQTGWQVMLYDKNVFNTTAITGTFLNSDDTGLPTNVFLTDPKLIGVRVTKNW